MIFNLSLLRKDANLSRLVLRNLNESMNRNFIHFCESILSAVSLIYLVNEIYFSFIGNTFTCVTRYLRTQ